MEKPGSGNHHDGHTKRATQNDKGNKTQAGKAAARGKGGKQVRNPFVVQALRCKHRAGAAQGKGGAGWVAGELAGPDALSAGDPNFVEAASPKNTTGKWVVPAPSAVEFKPVVARILNEYFACGDCLEVVRGLEEANALGCGLEWVPGVLLDLPMTLWGLPARF